MTYRARRTMSQMTRKIVFTMPFKCTRGAQPIRLLNCYIAGL
jgi:hypothetical protein